MPAATPSSRGLTSAEVAERVARGETNAFKARVGRSYWDIIRDNVLNLFNIVLFSLLIVVLWFGDYGTVFFAGISVVTNSFMGMIQEIFAKRKLDKLAELSAHEVPVFRDGALTSVKIAEVVKDDVIPLQPGDRLVVDGTILEADSLELDEAQLTGESDAVLKDVGDEVNSGSFCIAGSGVMVATRVGKDSTLSKLSSAAKIYKNVQTPTQRKISLIVQISVVIMAVCVPLIFIAGYLTNQSIINLDTFRNAVVFVTSIVPQGLVLTAILALTLGAISISRHQTLVQRVNAVESMANVSVLCFDKTGTLTRNQLTVTEIQPLDGASADDVRAKLALYTANLSTLNSTAAAIADYVDGAGAPVSKQHEIPFSSARKWGAIAFSDQTLILGAPERVLKAGRDDAALRKAQTLSMQGLRIMAFGRADAVPEDGQLADEREALALIVLSDQVRDNIREVLDSFHEQDVALKVISGDNLETVRAIAQQAGMTINRAYTGDQIEAMSEHQLDDAVAEADLFARVEPDTKRKIIAALKRGGHYVAMVGDGVNDVPALKEAHLAVVMNAGAQIAKDVAELVLLDNNMNTLPRAFQEGRQITQTIFATSKIFLVKNLYSLLMFLFAGLMLLPYPINPIQISWVTFGVINLPAGLITLYLLRPQPMKYFRRDVLDYVVSGGFIGGVAMSMLYGIVFFTGGRNLNLARSAVMMFIAFYGLTVFWNIHGVTMFEPRTIARYPRIFLLGLALLVFTVGVPYLVPQIIEYSALTPRLWLILLVIWLISAGALYGVMRSRVLANRIWELISPP